MPKKPASSKSVKIIKKKTTPSKTRPKAKAAAKKKKPAPKIATPPQLEKRLQQLKLEKAVKVQVQETQKPRPKTVDKLPAELVQVPFKKVKLDGVLFHRKIQMMKIADLYPTRKTGEIGLLSLPIEEAVPNGVSHFGMAITEDGFKFKFNEYENVRAYPIGIRKN